MGSNDPKTCQDCGKPADERYTMDFTDVESGAFVYWCAECGPEANEMNDALIERMQEPGFASKLEQEINKLLH